MIDSLPAGLVRDMPADRYHADKSVSNTMLSAMNKSPAHCYALHLAPGRQERQRIEDERIRREREHLEQAKAEQDRIARQREIDGATLIEAATEAHEFLDTMHPGMVVTLKLGAALKRERARKRKGGEPEAIKGAA